MQFRRFRSVALAAFLSLTLIAAAATSALADPRDFTLVNNSSSDVVNVYVSPSSVTNWGDDVLGSAILPSGNSIDISFDGAMSTCSYDVKVNDDSGSTGYLRSVDLCNTDTVTYHD